MVEVLKVRRNNKIRCKKNFEFLGDAELHKELIKKYEESIEHNIQLESKGDENQRKIAELEAELRRTRDKLLEHQNAMRKMHDLAQDAERNPDGTKRTRSLSPGKTPLPPAEALRAVRSAIRNKDNEIDQLDRKLKMAENQVEQICRNQEMKVEICR